MQIFFLHPSLNVVEEKNLIFRIWVSFFKHVKNATWPERCSHQNEMQKQGSVRLWVWMKILKVHCTQIGTASKLSPLESFKTRGESIWLGMGGGGVAKIIKTNRWLISISTVTMFWNPRRIVIVHWKGVQVSKEYICDLFGWKWYQRVADETVVVQ